MRNLGSHKNVGLGGWILSPKGRMGSSPYPCFQTSDWLERLDVSANSLESSINISSSLVFIRNYFKSTPHLTPLDGLLPSPWVAFLYAASWMITAVSERTFCCGWGWTYRILHVSIGGVCLLTVAVAVFLTEAKLVNFVFGQVLGIKKDKKN